MPLREHLKDVALQPVWCPIAGAIHPEAATVERLAVEWLDDVQPYSDEHERDRLLATHSAEFIARMAPSADIERLVIGAVFLYLDFGFDDIFCDGPQTQADPIAFVDAAEQFQRALEIQSPVPVAGSSELHRYCKAQFAAAAQLRELVTSVQYARFTTYHRSWLAGVLAQITTNALRQPLTVSEYVRQRILSSGGWTAVALAEITGPEVPFDLLHTPAVRALAEMMTTVAFLDNDRHSALRERSRSETSPNIFQVLVDMGRTTAEAVTETTALRDQILTRFLRLRDRVHRDASPALRQLVDKLSNTIAGNAEWGMRVARYHRLYPAHAPLRWATEPTDAEDGPPGIAAIDWWWAV